MTEKVKHAEKKRTEEDHSFRPVSSRYLYRLLTSERFLSNFKSALQKVRKESNEYGYEILKEVGSDQTHLSELIKGGENALLFEYKKEHERAHKLFPGKSFFEFGTLHFHPLEEIVVPSSNDLALNSTSRQVNSRLGCNFPPIDMIALVKGGKVLILAYQEPLGVLNSKFAFDLLDDTLAEAETQNEVIAILTASRYKAMMLRAHASGDFYREDVIKFADYFAFTPEKENRESALYKWALSGGGSRTANYIKKLIGE